MAERSPWVAATVRTSSPSRNAARVVVRGKEGTAMNPRRTGIVLGAALVALNGIAAAQRTERVNVNDSGAQTDAVSRWPAMSADGRFVVFDSDGSNLIPGDVNQASDVFVRDRLRGTIECVSVDSSGVPGWQGSFHGTFSADGRFVAFESAAALVSDDNNHRIDVFVRDRSAGTTIRASVDSSGVEQNGGGFDETNPKISADGRFVAFNSDATNLVPGDTNGAEDIFVHDCVTGATERVSVNSAGEQGDANSWRPAISADGTLVAFDSGATNLVPGGNPGKGPDVFVRDRLTSTTECASVSLDGSMEGDSLAVAISGDGRFVGFWSASENLVPGDTNGQGDVFLRDRVQATTELVSVSSAGIQGDGISSEPYPQGTFVSSDGRFVAFLSDATNLVSGDNNGVTDALLRDRLLATTSRVSVDSNGHEADARTYELSVSGDGRYTAFVTTATNLVPGDTNGVGDVFVHGPYLTLEAEPPQVAAGATLTFSTWTGDASNLALLALIDIDGVPMFLPAVLSTFDANGVWSFSAAVPPGLSGSVMMLQTFGFVPTGKVQVSNDVAVTFQ
jgi:Tol biopolymer transport system component